MFGETVVCVWCVQVLLELTRQVDLEKTVLSLSVCQLGAEGNKRSFDMSVTSYLRRVTLDYCDVPGNMMSECEPAGDHWSSSGQLLSFLTAECGLFFLKMLQTVFLSVSVIKFR